MKKSIFLPKKRKTGKKAKRKAKEILILIKTKHIRWGVFLRGRSALAFVNSTMVDDDDEVGEKFYLAARRARRKV